MKIKKFIADTAKEALLQVREELGPKAVILKTQKTQNTSLMGMFQKGKVEVTAALDGNLYAKPESKEYEKKVAEAVDELKLYNSKGDTAKPLRQLGRAEAKEGGFTDEKFRLAEIHDDVEEVKNVLRGLAEHIKHKDLPPMHEKLTALCADLIEKEVKSDIAVRVALRIQAAMTESELEDDSKISRKAAEALSSQINASGPFALKERRSSRIMLVGPTGAGKTTTLAKLAAQYGILQRKRIRIVTADTYRIAAIEQLKTFSDICDIPMEAVFSTEDMTNALSRMSASSDLILIDTAGRSQHNREHMEDLKQMVETVDPDELHLVVSATTKLSDLYEIADRYRLLGVSRCIITKMDETCRYGAIYNFLLESKTPFSYMTTGQSVPDDIEEANAVTFSKMLVKGGRDD